MNIIDLLRMAGPFRYPLVLVALIVVGLALRNGWRLARGRLPAGRAGDLRLQALPFWGGIAVLVGFLGQVGGHYKMLGVIATAPVVNPKLVMYGLRECLVSTIAGLVICLVALLCWGGLRWWQRVKEARA